MAWLLPTEGPALPQVRKKEQWELGEGWGGGRPRGWGGRRLPTCSTKREFARPVAAPFLMDPLILGCPPPPPRACSSPLMGRTSSWVCGHYTICLGFYTFSIKTQKQEKCTRRAHQQKKKQKNRTAGLRPRISASSTVFVVCCPVFPNLQPSSRGHCGSAHSGVGHIAVTVGTLPVRPWTDRSAFHANQGRLINKYLVSFPSGIGCSLYRFALLCLLKLCFFPKGPEWLVTGILERG